MSQQLQFSVFQLSSAWELTASHRDSFMMSATLSWKMKAKLQLGSFGNVPSSFPYTSEHMRFWDCFLRPIFVGKQACSAHGYWTCLYQLSYFLGSQTHDYLMKHRSSSFSFLYPAPVTFLSEAFKKKSAVTVAERKFNFWVGNWRIIHEQISSKWYDLLNFGLWFIFMYSCYCYKVVPASIRSWMRSF